MAGMQMNLIKKRIREGQEGEIRFEWKKKRFKEGQGEMSVYK